MIDISKRRKAKPAGIDDLVVEIQDELPSSDDLTGALQCAADCCTLEDMRANLEDAAEAAEALARELRELLAQARRAP